MEIEVRRTPEQIAAELLANPELRQQVAELVEQSEDGGQPRAERKLIVASPSVQ